MECASGGDVGWRRGMAHPCQAPHGHGTATQGHGDNCEVQCSPAVRKKPGFTHVGDNLRGDVSGKRFSTHVMEGNVERIGVGRCGNDKGMESVSGSDVRLRRVGAVGLGHRARQELERGMHRHVALSRVPVTGYCHESLPRISATAQHHSGI